MKIEKGLKEMINLKNFGKFPKMRLFGWVVRVLRWDFKKEDF